jgi:hypothetical protein
MINDQNKLKKKITTSPIEQINLIHFIMGIGGLSGKPNAL